MKKVVQKLRAFDKIEKKNIKFLQKSQRYYVYYVVYIILYKVVFMYKTTFVRCREKNLPTS